MDGMGWGGGRWLRAEEQKAGGRGNEGMAKKAKDVAEIDEGKSVPPRDSKHEILSVDIGQYEKARMPVMNSAGRDGMEKWAQIRSRRDGGLRRH
jgi:hypothetical protein